MSGLVTILGQISGFDPAPGLMFCGMLRLLRLYSVSAFKFKFIQGKDHRTRSVFLLHSLPSVDANRSGVLELDMSYPPGFH